jgi:uncharacterized alkaline shock family protein YloU
VEGQATISPEVLASYAADAAREVDGVRGLVERPLPGRRAVRVTSDGERTQIELHVAVDWGAPIPEVGIAVQERVREYLTRMTDVDLARIEVVVDEVGPRL